MEATLALWGCKPMMKVAIYFAALCMVWGHKEDMTFNTLRSKLMVAILQTTFSEQREMHHLPFYNHVSVHHIWFQDPIFKMSHANPEHDPFLF